MADKENTIAKALNQLGSSFLSSRDVAGLANFIEEYFVTDGNDCSK